MTYWSYLGTEHNTDGWHLRAVEKYGDIYINRSGGWMHKAAVAEIHQTVSQQNWPTPASEWA